MIVPAIRIVPGEDQCPSDARSAGPQSGFGMVKVSGPAVPVDFDVASLLKPADKRPPARRKAGR